MKVSLGLGLTNDCNLSCAHCYRPGPDIRNLSLDQIRSTLDSLDASGVNLGTGESLFHPQFDAILDELFARGLPVSLVSNGTTLLALPLERLARLREAEVSIDFSDVARMDAFRGPGAHARALAALDKCREAGLPTTVLAVLMRDNHRDLPSLARLAAAHGAPLRVNVYQPVHTREFLPTWHEFWYAVESLLAETVLLGCSEPVIAAIAGLSLEGTPCGRGSVRVTPSGERRSCVYWPGDPVPAAEFRRLPVACEPCPAVAVCGGGCASRRKLLDVFDAPDPYCPFARGPRAPIKPRLAAGVERLHLASVCTLLVRADPA